MTITLSYQTFVKIARGTCCTAQCEDCPFAKRWQGGGVIDGTNSFTPQIQSILESIAIENAPNAEFHNNPQADAIVRQLRQYARLTSVHPLKGLPQTPDLQTHYELYFGKS